MKRANMGGSNNSNTKQNFSYGSYQQSGGGSAGGSYQPPVHYARDQTKTLEDTTSTFYQADNTATAVLNQMTAQRQQISGAHENVYEMRQAMERAKQEMVALQNKYRDRKRKLYVTIFLLGMTDFLLLVRLFQCHGSFFC